METFISVTNLATFALIVICLEWPPCSYSLVDVPRRNITYTWKAGAWGACYSSHRCGEGSRERSIRCMDSEGLNALAPNCDSKTKPAPVEHCFKVCEEHRSTLRWRVGDWSLCRLMNSESLPLAGDFCQETTGVSVRNVSCIYMPDNSDNVKAVESAACEYFEHSPDSEMTCTVQCPQDCVVSNFSDWSLCDSCKVKHRTRVRTVLVAPSAGGKPCPPLSEMAPCDAIASCLQQPFPDIQFLLKISDWSPCQLIGGERFESQSSTFTHHPVVGQRTRNLTCLNTEGEEVDMSYCHQRNNLEVTEFSENCIIPQACRVSPWTEWMVRREGCITSEGRIFSEVRIRTRQLLQLPSGDGQPCPLLYEKRIITKDLSPCYKYKWVPSVWGECVIIHQEEQDYSEILKPLCGGGIQQRNLTCLRVADQVPVSSTFCKEVQPVSIQRCNVPCPRDCVLSEWSQWSSCLPLKRVNRLYLTDKGYEERKRTILVEPTPDGIQCDTLHEINFCSDLKVYKWEYGPWSECSLKDPSKECGPGVRERTVKCVNEDGTEAIMDMCNIHMEPVEDNDSCYIPCPEDCTVSEWSSWSLCAFQCSDTFKIQVRNKTVLAPPSLEGEQCPKLEDLEEGTPCDLGSCTGIHWKTLPWQVCKTSGNDVCGEGTQQREVFCVREEDYIISNRKCDLLPKPITEQACVIPCPEDCITTKFSEWSPCPNSCDTESVQTRERYILQWPRFGGKPCPIALLEARICSAKNELLCMKESIANLTTFHWDKSSWSDCILSTNARCGKGYQTRKLVCIRGDGKEVEPFNCLQQSVTEESLNTYNIPSTFRVCFITCNKSCSFSAWSSWTCDNYCGTLRSRRRELIGPSVDHHLCQKYFDTKENGDPCFVSHIAQRSSHWLDCIIAENGPAVKVNGKTVTGRCGGGFRFKYGNSIDEKECLQKGVQVEVCEIECSFDCKMSLWSAWSPCNTSCGMGYRHRRREIISQANKLGRPCPTTELDAEVQSDVCTVACDRYHWVSGLWTSCELLHHNHSKQCGHGRQFREVNCADTKFQYKRVSEDFCDPLLRPDSENPCYLFCPKDCVVSNWSSWSQCTECASHEHQLRTRKILRRPGTSGMLCPSLRETKGCELNINCFQYNWVLGNWTSCILPEEVICGEGRMQRALFCHRSDGRQVDSSFCIKAEKPIAVPKHLMKTCFVDCPIDCVLSEWSEWDNSSCQQCGPSGSMLRSRHIIQSNSDTGQPCPQHLVQRKPCPFNPCYHWHVSPWSDCNLQGVNCGYGLRYRTVLCLNDNGTTVKNEKCLLVNFTSLSEGWVDTKWLSLAHDIKEEETCQVPCPGDCTTTAWSLWSFCHRDCLNGEKVGYRTRSRAILVPPSKPSGERCPQELWQSQPCWEGPCYTFEWKMLNQSLQCLRSDGLLVHGGCQGKPRPCLPDCLLPHARCNHTVGECDCDPGFVPVYELSPQPAEDRLRSSDEESVEEVGTTAASGNGDVELAFKDTVARRRRLIRCAMLGTMDTGQHVNHTTTTTEEIPLKYYPDDNEASFWMYAMITIGTAFVIFVFVTVYLMCRSTIRQRMVSVQRQASVRRRMHSPEDPNSTWKSSQYE